MPDRREKSPQSPPRFNRVAPGILLGLLIIVGLISPILYHPTSETTSSAFDSPPTQDLQQEVSGIDLPSANEKISVNVRNGDTLSSIFKSRDHDLRILDEMIKSAPEARQIQYVNPGQTLIFEENTDKEIVSLEVIKSPLESFRISKAGDHYNFDHRKREPEIQRVSRHAVINDSLFSAAKRGGIPDSMILELAGIFGGVIDFILDVRKGDTFKLLFEEKLLDGKKIGVGKILAAEFINQGKSFVAIRHESGDGSSGFYNPAGQSMRKAFLLNPVDFTRISDGFSLARKHPILNLIRAHKGTDYSAPSGTPVIATADGKVTFAGNNGSFGNLVVIQHGEHYTTKYAHLSGFTKISKNGARVRQGETIGFVGASGAATGPHLHYEFLIDGKHRDSRKIFDKLPQAESLPSGEMKVFQHQARDLLAELSTPSTAKSIATNKAAPTKKEEPLIR